MTIAFVGVGSNLDDPRAQVLNAFSELDRMPHTRVVRKSSLYRSAPMGHTQQPDFINAVAELDTALPAERLLAELQEVESRHGRKRTFPNAPRTLDLDILLFGDLTLDTATLKIPHPRLQQRAFVLEPLLEIAPRLPFHEHLQACREQRIEKIE